MIENPETGTLRINRISGAPVCIEFASTIHGDPNLLLHGRLIADRNGGLRYLNTISGNQTQLAY